jgi:hypothetical protein
MSKQKENSIKIHQQKPWTDSEAKRIFQNIWVDSTIQIPSHIDEETFNQSLRNCIRDSITEEEHTQRKRQKVDKSNKIYQFL